MAFEGKINYDFRASSTTRLVDIARHISVLSDEYPQLFNDIDVRALMIDVEALNILTYSCGVVRSIMDLKMQDGKQPIYVALGEDHRLPAHSLSHMIVMKALLQQGEQLSVGLEYREQAAKRFFLEECRHILKDDFDEDVASNYFDENDLSLSVLIQSNSKNAPYSKKILNEFLLQHRSDNGGICSVKLTDASLVIDGSGMESHLLDVEGSQNISAFSYNGKHIRNKYMVEQIKQVNSNIENNEDNIITIQISGSRHVYIDTSLQEFAQKAGFNAMGSVASSKAKSCCTVPFSKPKLNIAPDISDKGYRWKTFPKSEQITSDSPEVVYLTPKLNLFGMGEFIKETALDLDNKYYNELLGHIENIRKIVKQLRQEQQTPQISSPTSYGDKNNIDMDMDLDL